MARTPQFKLSLGKLVSQSFAIYFRNFVPFVLLSLVLLSPWVAAQILAPLDPYETTSRDLLYMLLQMLLTYVLTSALTYGVVQQMRGKPAGIGEAVAKGLQAFGRVLGTGLICVLRIILFSILLYIPGIWEQCRLYVALPAAVMEGSSGSAAVERSIRLTDGSKWQIFGSWFIIFLIPTVLLVVATFMTTSMDSDVVLPWWLEIATQLIFAPLSAVAMSVCYFLLREGKENKSAEELAAIFD